MEIKVEKYSARELCDQINQNIQELSYSYDDRYLNQELTLADRPAVRFPRFAGGHVAGGSYKWIKEKHKDESLHEPGVIAAFLAISEIIPSARTIFDIGALYGYFSFLGKIIFKESEVHAFEVNPESYKALKKNIHANQVIADSAIFAYHCALSDYSIMKAKLNVHKLKMAANGGLADRKGRGQSFSIDVWSLDDFCLENSLNPDVIKIDVEGYQAKIIPGAMEIISSSRPFVLLEFDAPVSGRDFGISNKEVIEPLIREGYSLIWGMHRDTKPDFQLIDWVDLSSRHEINSLGILVP